MARLKPRAVSARERALAFAKRGFHVFPVGKNKKPLTKKGEYSDERWSASNDIATVHMVFGKFPEAAIGIATGESGLVVADFDKKSGGLDYLKTKRGKLGCDYLPDTPSGGAHAYYEAPTDKTIRDSASKLAPGVDIRGEGGYVVAYGDADPTELKRIRPMPSWLLEDLLALNKRTIDFSQTRARHGERSDRLIKYGGALVARGKSWTIVEREVAKEADRCVPPFGSAPGEERELEDTVMKSLRRYYEEEQAQRRPRKKPNGSGPVMVKAAKVLEIETSEDRLLLGAEELNVRQELPPQLIEGLLEQQTECSIIGPAGAAKSLIALELGVAVATGRRFFGHKCHQGPVLYLCGEGAGGIRRRFQAIVMARGVDPQGVPFAVLPRAFDLEGPEIEDALDEFEKRYGDSPVLVIVDTYSRYVGREKDENASGDLYGFFANLADAVGGSVARIVLHHTGHGDPKRGRGTSAWDQAVDTEFVVRVEDDPPKFDSVRILENTKQKDGEMAEPIYFKLHKTATRTTREKKTLWSVTLEETAAPEEKRVERTMAQTKSMGANQQKVLAIVLEFDGKKTRAEIMKICVDRKMDRNRAHESFNALRARGFVQILKGLVHTTEKAKAL